MTLVEALGSRAAPRVWLRAFWGFAPEDEGYLGFTREGNRTRFVNEYQDGDLVLIYGADEKHTRPEQRRQLLGFLDIEPRLISDLERSSENDQRWKRENGFTDRWTFALPVKRAWRINRRIDARHLVPHTFAAHEAILIASRGELLNPKEIEAVLALPVSPTNVFGEPPLPIEQTEAETTLQKLFSPSKGFTPSFGERTHTVEDDETFLYVLALDGHLGHFLGRQPYEVARKVVIKIGLAKDPQVRCDTHNQHLPPACKFKWRVLFKSRAFTGAQSAKLAEDQLKDLFDRKFESLGGEFFLVDEDKLQSEFSNVAPAAFVLKALN